MRVLMLSWEYPPVVVGGLGRHVHALAEQLAAQGHEVVVLCRQPTGTDASTHPTEFAERAGVRVVRVAEDPPHLAFERDLVAWTLAMGHAMIRAGHALLREWRADVVHAHDWLVAHPAIALAEAADVPLVATLHATETGRHSGWLPQPMNQQIHSVEWWLANRADRLITCSAAMRGEVAQLFDVDPDGIAVLHNGISPSPWHVPDELVAKARSSARATEAPLLLFFGRIEWEKGAQDLVAALPAIRRSHPGTVVAIAGQGGYRERLIEETRKHRVRRAVRFLGQLPDRKLATMLAAADAVVLPSRYEPFGIVALEAAAAGAPLVASTAGGLGEAVLDERTGLSFAPGDIDGLATAVRRVLTDPAGAARRAEAARARLATDFSWDTIAEGTVEVYAAAKAAVPARGSTGDACAPPGRPELARPKIPSGNLLSG
ncbi:glycosyltransferase family 4 protein [Actinoalloteichus hymeniacidonis]|uniref:(1->4)-alpha-D-glucan synthase (UDP-glucose) n=1 Tax=Actinoalloteichus hymeniacidonis TaxID=340345 RepID=A0AAC9HNQ8_9PSEU|nr:glycosyltransferase family 4 protein [Actinoalloteichus hymeniacidonis]AOS62151.1 (1->4)-alpha-D-glucan synthase (UDP-glucose) [Actinoalloteichus hymeniacidonis]MBB5909827.1 glycogen(starch) synthase [Actinoalloteichus hymeniacidonis]